MTVGSPQTDNIDLFPSHPVPGNGSKILSLQHHHHHPHHPSAGTLEGRTIEYRPGGGLDYHNSPLMAEIPTGDYSHIHRSIDQLRSMNERGMLGQLNALTAAGNSTDLRSAIAVHEYKPYISDLRQQQNIDRIDYAAVVHKQALDEQQRIAANNNNNSDNDLRHPEDQKPTLHYSAPSTPPTPLSISETQMHESKRYGMKTSRNRKVHHNKRPFQPRLRKPSS